MFSGRARRILRETSAESISALHDLVLDVNTQTAQFQLNRERERDALFDVNKREKSLLRAWAESGAASAPLQAMAAPIPPVYLRMGPIAWHKRWVRKALNWRLPPARARW